MINRKIIIIVLAVLAVFAIGLNFTGGNVSGKGTLVVEFQLPDTDAISLTLNGEPEQVQHSNETYELKPGDYQMKVTKPGYTDFSTEFNLKRGGTATIVVSMQRNQTPAAINSSSSFVKDFEMPGVNVTNTVYFYDHTWAFVTITGAYGDPAFLVAHYDDTTGKWAGVLGPGTQFDDTDTANLPADVVTYMQDNDYVSSSEDYDE